MTIEVEIDRVVIKAGDPRLTETTVLRRTGHIPAVRVFIGSRGVIAQDRGHEGGFVTINEIEAGGQMGKSVDYFGVTGAEPVVKEVENKIVTFRFTSPRAERLQRARTGGHGNQCGCDSCQSQGRRY